MVFTSQLHFTLHSPLFAVRSPIIFRLDLHVAVAVDASTPAVDACTPAVNAYTPAVNASTPAVNAFASAVDNGMSPMLMSPMLSTRRRCSAPAVDVPHPPTRFRTGHVERTNPLLEYQSRDPILV